MIYNVTDFTNPANLIKQKKFLIKDEFIIHIVYTYYIYTKRKQIFNLVYHIFNDVIIAMT